jgi:hypothetical protein
MEELQQRHDELEVMVGEMRQEARRKDSEARATELLTEHEAAAAKVEEQLLDRIQAAKVEILNANESAHTASHAHAIAEKEAGELRAQLQTAETRAGQEIGELKAELADESRELMKVQLELAAANSSLAAAAAATSPASTGVTGPSAAADAPTAAAAAAGLRGGAGQPKSMSIKDQVRKRYLLSTFYMKTTVIPRQAREKHRESTQKTVFSRRHASDHRAMRPRSQAWRHAIVWLHRRGYVRAAIRARQTWAGPSPAR